MIVWEDSQASFRNPADKWNHSPLDWGTCEDDPEELNPLYIFFFTTRGTLGVCLLYIFSDLLFV